MCRCRRDLERVYIWETLKGRECWVASEAAEEKCNWGKAFQFAPEEGRESRMFIFSHQHQRNCFKQGVLKKPFLNCITVQLPQSCPPRGTHHVFSRPQPAQWHGILLQVMKGCSREQETVSRPMLRPREPAWGAHGGVGISGENRLAHPSLSLGYLDLCERVSSCVLIGTCAWQHHGLKSALPPPAFLCYV